MQKYSDDVLVQLVCMQTLAYFYEYNSPAIDSYNVFGALEAIFTGLEKFLHRESFLQSAVHLFSNLVFIEEYCTICDCCVEQGYVHIFADHLKVILSSTISSADEMRRNELVYTNIMKTLRGILTDKHLCTQMVLQSIKDVIPVGMAKFETNLEVQYAACKFFRIVFFPLSEIRRLEIVKLYWTGVS